MKINTFKLKTEEIEDIERLFNLGLFASFNAHRGESETITIEFQSYLDGHQVEQKILFSDVSAMARKTVKPLNQFIEFEKTKTILQAKGG